MRFPYSALLHELGGIASNFLLLPFNEALADRVELRALFSWQGLFANKLGQGQSDGFLFGTIERLSEAPFFSPSFRNTTGVSRSPTSARNHSPIPPRHVVHT